MKKLLRNLALSIILALSIGTPLKASHFAGADLTYTCLGGSTYRITLSFYKDCSGISEPAQAPILFSCSSNPVFNMNISLPQIAGTGMEITPGCAALPTSCSFNGGNSPNYGHPYGIKEVVYQAVVTMPPCDEWSMYWASGARNPISTLMTSGSWYIPAKLNNLDAPCNSSPTFSNRPIAITCINQQFTFNHGAQDPDGDSLSYSFYAPYTSGPSPLTSVMYLPPYSSTNFLLSSTPITINQVTGDVTFTPTMVQSTVTGIRVDEWREINGIMENIGSVYRDIQLVVVACNNMLPVLSGMDTNLTATYNPADTVYYLEKCRSNDPIKFHINGFDADTFNPGNIGNPERFKISWNNGIPGANFNIINNNSDSAYATFEWLPTANDVSTIPKCFTVTVQDEACGYNGVQTFSYCLVIRGMLVEIGSDTLLCKGEELIVNTIADTTTVNYEWYMNGTLIPGLTPTQDSLIIDSGTLTEGTNYLSIKTNDGSTTMACPGTDMIEIEVVYQPVINGTIPDTAFCSGGDVTFDAGKGTVYNWTNYNGFSLGTSQTHTFENTGIYYLYVDGGSNTRCVDNDTFKIYSITGPEPIIDTCLWASDSPFTIDVDKEYPTIDADMVFEWSTGSNDRTIDVSISGNYSVSVSHPTISSSVKCSTSGDITVIDQATIIEGIPYQAVEDEPMPGSDWTAGDQDVCTYQRIRFRGPIPPSGFAYNYLWKQDGSQVSSTDFFFFMQKEMGDYELSLNINGCEDKVTVTAINCEVDVPNIITPNGDGMNDQFRIMLTGDGAPPFFNAFPNSTLIIYNRWGKKVYESNNYQNEWDGEDLTDGVYYWNLFLADGKETEMNGTVTILRK